MAQVDYWNHNVHYQPVIFQAVPAGCGAALEVGCGDGMLARRLAGRCAEVTAIDRERDSGAPVKDPEMTWAEVRGAARRLLPGVRYRRHLLWRYSLRWTKPLLADVGGGAVGDAEEFGVRGGEHGVRVARRGPDHVVLVQPDVHQGPDRAGVAHRGDAADGLTRPFTDRTGVGSSHLRHASEPRHPGGVHAVRAAGHDEERRPVRVEHQAVRDRAEFAAELGGGRRGGRRALRQFPHLARDAQVTEHGGESREVN